MTATATPTASSAEGVLPSRRNRSPDTKGASTNDSSTASMIGTKTARPRYSAATTTTPVANDSSPVSPGISAPATEEGDRDGKSVRGSSGWVTSAT